MKLQKKFLPQLRLFLLLAFVGVVMLSLSALPPETTMAQGSDRPTPTDIGDGRGGGGDDDDDGDGSSRSGPPPLPIERQAGVSGYVYDYSNGVYVKGITVVFKENGDGWQAEAVTDSNGYYKISGLDSNGGTLNLRLPPGTQPLTFDWPIRLVRGQDTTANLGYYWSNPSYLPVKLSAELEGNQLVVQIENRTSEPATGGNLKISSPPGIKTSPPVQIDEGQIVDYNPNHFQISVEEIAAGETESMQIHTEGIESLQANQTESQIRLTFTYDQQITPQMIELDAGDLPSLPLELSAAPEPLSSQQEEVFPKSEEPASLAVSTPEPPQPSVSQASEAPGVGERADQKMNQPDVRRTPSAREQYLPVTGVSVKPIGMGILLFSWFVVTSLCVYGIAAVLDGKYGKNGD